MILSLLLACATGDHPVQEALPANAGELCDADSDCASKTCWQPEDTGCAAVCSSGCFDDGDCEDLAAELPDPGAVVCGDDGFCDLSAAGAPDYACE